MAHGLKAMIRQIAVDTRTSNPLRRNQRQPSAKNVGSITQARAMAHGKFSGKCGLRFQMTTNTSGQIGWYLVWERFGGQAQDAVAAAMSNGFGANEIDAIVMKVPEVRQVAGHPRQMRGGGQSQEQHTECQRFAHRTSSIGFADERI
jgi:hypothetical protein